MSSTEDWLISLVDQGVQLRIGAQLYTFPNFRALRGWAWKHRNVELSEIQFTNLHVGVTHYEYDE